MKRYVATMQYVIFAHDKHDAEFVMRRTTEAITTKTHGQLIMGPERVLHTSVLPESEYATTETNGS